MNWIWGGGAYPNLYIGQPDVIDMNGRLERARIALIITSLTHMQNAHVQQLRDRGISHYDLDPSPYMRPQPEHTPTTNSLNQDLKKNFASLLEVMDQLTYRREHGMLIICCQADTHQSYFLAACMQMVLTGMPANQIATGMDRRRWQVEGRRCNGELHSLLKEYCLLYTSPSPRD